MPTVSVISQAAPVDLATGLQEFDANDAVSGCYASEMRCFSFSAATSMLQLQASALVICHTQCLIVY